MSTYQDSFCKKLKAFQNKLYNKHIQLSGTSLTGIAVNLTIDKYHNNKVLIDSFETIDIMFNFPNNEIPTSLSNNSSENGNNVLHMYDILPITCNIKTDDYKTKNIKLGSIILYRIQNFDDSYQVIPFQIIDATSKGNPSGVITYAEFVVAPVTTQNIINDDNFKDLLEYYRVNGTITNYELSNDNDILSNDIASDEVNDSSDDTTKVELENELSTLIKQLSTCDMSEYKTLKNKISSIKEQLESM